MQLPILCPCNSCKHLAGDEVNGAVCAAFPKRIPDGIIAGLIQHLEPVRGDHGIQYEERQDPSED